jgi:hypothetical protein
MIDHLADIYEDRYRVQNAWLEYQSLMMRLSESFADFYTRFLHLAGEAHIPTPDLWPDLFDKLTIEDGAANILDSEYCIGPSP